jgi:hypothetical protein
MVSIAPAQSILECPFRLKAEATVFSSFRLKAEATVFSSFRLEAEATVFCFFRLKAEATGLCFRSPRRAASIQIHVWLPASAGSLKAPP